MKVLSRFILLLAVILASAGMAEAAAEKAPPPVPGPAASAAAGPSIQLSEMSFDFGDLVDGNEYAHDFKVRNAGSATLEIKKVLPG